MTHLGRFFLRLVTLGLYGVTSAGDHDPLHSALLWNDSQSKGARQTFRTRLPQCMQVTVDASQVERSANGSRLRINIGFQFGDVSNWLTAPDNQTVSFCFPLSPQLLHCYTSRYGASEYRIENHSLFNGTQFLAALGDYYVDGSGAAYACDQPVRADRTTARCNRVRLNGDQYVVLQNGSFYIKPANALVDRPQFAVDNQSGVANLCYPLSVALVNCEPRNRITIPPYQFAIRKNLELMFLRNDSQLIGLGDYYFVDDDSGDATICVEFSLFYKLVRVLMVVTVICLILSCVCLLADPKITRHKKCFACHSGSAAVSGMLTTYNKFVTSPPPDVVNYLLFVSSYMSAFATFIWLTIVGYDICKSFASLNGPHLQQRGTGSAPVFLYYSVIGWGMPALLLAIVLTVNFNPALQRVTSLNLDIGGAGWFHDHRALFAFYFGPLQVLLCVNGIFFVCTVYHIRKAGKGTTLVNNRRRKQL